jgi:hypothetical protein
MTGSVGGDDRGVSESASVAVLVLLTVLVAGSVGVGVLFADTSGDDSIDATFSFQYFSERAVLLVTYEEGPELGASSLVVRGPADTLSWAQLRGLNDSATVSPGARAQLNANNPYGDRVPEGGNVSIVYVEGGNETLLGSWSGEG